MLLDYVEKVANEKGKTAITCRVAIDLESNKFWSACGYNIQATTISTYLNQKESKKYGFQITEQLCPKCKHNEFYEID